MLFVCLVVMSKEKDPKGNELRFHVSVFLKNVVYDDDIKLLLTTLIIIDLARRERKPCTNRVVLIS